MTVKCPSPPQSMPTTHKKNDDENTNQDDAWRLTRTYSWINRKGQPVSPPLEYAKPISPYSKWSYTRSSKDKIRKVCIYKYFFIINFNITVPNMNCR